MKYTKDFVRFGPKARQMRKQTYTNVIFVKKNVEERHEIDGKDSRTYSSPLSPTMHRFNNYLPGPHLSDFKVKIFYFFIS